MNHPCDYRTDDKAGTRCGRSSTHVCLVECIGETGPQSRTERRCEIHSINEETHDVIDAWTDKEWEAMN